MFLEGGFHESISAGRRLVAFNAGHSHGDGHTLIVTRTAGTVRIVARAGAARWVAVGVARAGTARAWWSNTKSQKTGWKRHG